MMQNLNTEFMAKDNEKYIFYFKKLHKIWSKGQTPPTIPYNAFGINKAVCLFERLNDYINHQNHAVNCRQLHPVQY